MQAGHAGDVRGQPLGVASLADGLDLVHQGVALLAGCGAVLEGGQGFTEGGPATLALPEGAVGRGHLGVQQRSNVGFQCVVADVDACQARGGHHLLPSGAYATLGQLLDCDRVDALVEFLVQDVLVCDARQVTGPPQARFPLMAVLAVGGVAVGEDPVRAPQCLRAQQGGVGGEVGAFDTGDDDAVIVQVKASCLGECGQQVGVGCAFDQDGAPGEEDLGAGDVDIALEVGRLGVGEHAGRYDGADGVVALAAGQHDAGQGGDGGDVRAVGGQQEPVGLVQQVGEHLALEAGVEVGLGLLHGQECVLAVAGLAAQFQPLEQQGQVDDVGGAGGGVLDAAAARVDQELDAADQVVFPAGEVQRGGQR